MTEYTGQVMDTDEFLEHYGVKGMKWGHRKAISTEVAGGFIQRTKLRNKVNKQGRQAQRAGLKANLTVGKGRETAKENARHKKLDYLNNPDRVTAMTLTKGEKIATVLLSGNPIAGVVAVKIQGAATNRAEYMQKTGGYNQQHPKK